MDKNNMKKNTPLWRKAVCTFYHCPKHLICLMFGNEHKPHHRVITGLLIIILGTLIASIECTGFPHLLCEAGGFFVHGMGSVPIIEHIINIAKGTGAATAAATAVTAMTEEIPDNIAPEQLDMELVEPEEN